MTLKHDTVLKEQAIMYLNIKQDGLYVDGTLGGGGHSEAILALLGPKGSLFACDQDMFAIDYAKKRLRSDTRVTFLHTNFRELTKALSAHGIDKVDGILLDLGLSSFQIDDVDRGFTYLKETSLDMRMDPTQSLTAKEILNTYDVDQLATIFYRYGEEQHARGIARKIIESRPIETTMDLVKITDRFKSHEKGHSAKKVFQALRIAVNDELGALTSILEQSIKLLNPKGRLVIITFHSLEDRIVKQFFKEKSEVHLPKNLPVIDLPQAPCRIITKKPIYPDQKEMESNPRSRSAKLRVMEKIS